MLIAMTTHTCLPVENLFKYVAPPTDKFKSKLRFRSYYSIVVAWFSQGRAGVSLWDTCVSNMVELATLSDTFSKGYKS